MTSDKFVLMFLGCMLGVALCLLVLSHAWTYVLIGIAGVVVGGLLTFLIMY